MFYIELFFCVWPADLREVNKCQTVPCDSVFAERNVGKLSGLDECLRLERYLLIMSKHTVQLRLIGMIIIISGVWWWKKALDN